MISKMHGHKIINQNVLHYLRFTYLGKAGFMDIRKLALENTIGFIVVEYELQNLSSFSRVRKI